MICGNDDALLGVYKTSREGITIPEKPAFGGERRVREVEVLVEIEIEFVDEVYRVSCENVFMRRCTGWGFSRVTLKIM